MDKALQVIDEYHSNITNLEHNILLKPKMSRVRKFTLLWSFTFYLLNTSILFVQCISCLAISFFLEPIKTLICGLRRYDDDKCRALTDFSDPANEGVKVYVSYFQNIFGRTAFAVLHWHKLTAQSWYLGRCNWPYGIYLSESRYVF